MLKDGILIAMGQLTCRDDADSSKTKRRARARSHDRSRWCDRKMDPSIQQSARTPIRKRIAVLVLARNTFLAIMGCPLSRDKQLRLQLIEMVLREILAEATGEQTIGDDVAGVRMVRVVRDERRKVCRNAARHATLDTACWTSHHR